MLVVPSQSDIILQTSMKLSFSINSTRSLRCVCVLCVPCQSPTPSSGQLFFLQWSKTSLGLIGHPQLLKHTKQFVSIV